MTAKSIVPTASEQLEQYQVGLEASVMLKNWAGKQSSADGWAAMAHTAWKHSPHCVQKVPDWLSITRNEQAAHFLEAIGPEPECRNLELNLQPWHKKAALPSQLTNRGAQWMCIQCR